MADRTLQEFIDEARASDTREAALVGIVGKLKGKVDDVVAGKLSAEDQAKINEAFDVITANNVEVQAAIDADLADDVNPELPLDPPPTEPGFGDEEE